MGAGKGKTPLLAKKASKEYMDRDVGSKTTYEFGPALEP